MAVIRPYGRSAPTALRAHIGDTDTGGGDGVEIRTHDRCHTSGGMVDVTFNEGDDRTWRLRRKLLFDA